MKGRGLALGLHKRAGPEEADFVEHHMLVKGLVLGLHKRAGPEGADFVEHRMSVKGLVEGLEARHKSFALVLRAGLGAGPEANV